MPVVRWSEKFSVGVSELDLQHQRLIQVINDLAQGITSRLGKDALVDIFRRLNAYAREHFSDEEQLMKRHSYPGLEEHARLHGEFIDKMLRIELDFYNNKAELPEDLLDYLMDWFYHHVTVYDLLYSRFYRDKGII